MLIIDDLNRGVATPQALSHLLISSGFQDCFTKKGIRGPLFTSWPGKVVDFIQLNKKWNLPIEGCYMYYNSASDHCPIIMDTLLSKDAV